MHSAPNKSQSGSSMTRKELKYLPIFLLLTTAPWFVFFSSCAKQILPNYPFPISDSSQCQTLNAKVIVHAQPIYPAQELSEGNNATVEVMISMDETGRLTKIEILRSGGGDFDSAVVEAIRKSRYTPDYIHCAPVKTTFRKKFHFSTAGY